MSPLPMTGVGRDVRRRLLVVLLTIAVTAGGTVALDLAPAFAAEGDYTVEIVASAEVTEGNGLSGPLNLTVTVSRNQLTGPGQQEKVIVEFATGDPEDSATPGGAGDCSSTANTPDYYVKTDPRQVGVTFETTDINNAKKTATIEIQVCGDVVDEYDETFTVALTGASVLVAPNTTTNSEATLKQGGTRATGKIKNDDDPGVSVLEPQDAQEKDLPFRVLEGDSGATVVKIPIDLTNPSNEPIVVNYKTADGNNPDQTSPSPPASPQPLPPRNAKVSDGDYEPLEGQVTFAPSTSTSIGETRKEVSLAIDLDEVDEYDEDLRFLLEVDSSSGGATLNKTASDHEAIVTIVNDDDPTFVVGSAEMAEGSKAQNEAKKNNVMTFPVTIRGPSNEEVKLHYWTKSGTARGGFDYLEIPDSPKKTLTFKTGEGTATVTVELIGDDVPGEGDETFQLIVVPDTKDKVATSRLNAQPSQVAATGTILDDDKGPPTIGFPNPRNAGVENCGDHDQQDPKDPADDIYAVCLDEGQDGQVTKFTFPVVLSHPSQETVTVDYATADGTSTFNTGDYEVTDGALRFEPGQTVKTIVVDTNGDAFPGPNEHFFVRLSAPTGGTLRAATTGDPDPSSARGVVLNDDGPVIESEDATVVEPADGATATATFVLSLSEKSTKPVTVAYATASDTALAGSDFTAKQGTATIPAGSLRTEVPITVLGDDVAEGEETFVLELSDAAGGTLRRAKLTATITDNGAGVSAERPLDLACPSDEVPSSGYTDVSGPTHKLAIDCLAWWGITTGRGDGTYDPGGTVTRAQMASFVARAITTAGLTLPTEPPDHFSDDDGSPHEHAINQLTELGVITGKADGSYGVADPVSRGQTASLAARAYEVITGAELPGGEDAFSDDDTSPHEDNIDRVAEAGIVTGKADGDFDVAGETTRAQMASILMRTMDILVEEEFATTPSTTTDGSTGEGTDGSSDGTSSDGTSSDDTSTP